MDTSHSPIKKINKVAFRIGRYIVEVGRGD